MKNILCFGDSLTVGYYNYGESFHPYATRLSQLTNTNVDHVGYPGYDVQDLLENLLEIPLMKKSYDLCIILAGTNDIDNETIPDIIQLHKIAHKFGCKTIALTIPKIRFENVDPTLTITRNKINNILKNYSDNNLYKVIDIENLLTNDLYDNDGVHFTPQGYDKIAEIIANNIL